MSKDKEYLELFKLLDLDTEEKRNMYKTGERCITKDAKTREIDFIRTSHDTLAFGEIKDAKLESNS